MKYIKLETNSNDEEFEDTRFHIINYILRQGEVIIRSPIDEGRSRPDSREEEYAIVVGEELAYSFHIEPFKRGKQRRLEISVLGDDSQKLQEEASRLIKNTPLKQIDLSPA